MGSLHVSSSGQVDSCSVCALWAHFNGSFRRPERQTESLHVRNRCFSGWFLIGVPDKDYICAIRVLAVPFL